MIEDREFKRFVEVAEGLRSDHQTDEDAKWKQSPFRWIWSERSSKRRGALGEKLVAGWCEAHGLEVERSPDSQADRIIEGVRTEIKFSTLWKAKVYKFQQIRDQNYEILVCLGLSPFQAHAWVFEKDWLIPNIGGLSGLKPQHGGSTGLDTAWLSVSPTDVHPWMHGFGGDLGSAMRRLHEVLGLP